ncbi:MAG: hypothetical protein JW771_02730 [Candidatus Thermoplasmatota archaeon]|nr:hypothetical protein [Candidatus Thermoplasmatota archaeon]
MSEVSYSPVIFATTPTHDPFVWYFLLFIFFIGSIVALIILMRYSRTPDEWKHTSVIGGYYSAGRLKDLAESVKLTPASYVHDTPIKQFVQTIFFQKIGSVYGISENELQKLYQKDKQTLEQYVHDKELVMWILNNQPPPKRGGWFTRGSENKKNQYLLTLKAMVKKMEAWAE